MNTLSAPHSGQSLARRLVFFTIVFSSLVTLVLTSFQLFRDYRRDMTDIHDNLAQIRDVHLESISETLWATGRSRLKIQLEGMLKVRDMHYLAVREGDTVWAEAGRLTSDNIIRADLPIMHEHRGSKIQIGVLTAVATLDGVYDRIINEALVIFTSNAIKTFLVAGFMLVLIRGLITRHLTRIATYVRKLDVDGDPPPLRLDRPKHPGDELDATVDAIMGLRVAARDALDRYRDSEAHYRGLFENANDAIFIVDPRNGRILDANRRAQVVYGYSRSEFSTLTVHELGRAEDHPVADDIIRQVVTRGSAVFQRKHRTRSGCEVLVEVNASLVESGDTKLIISVVRDVTEREQTLAALRESEERYRSVVTSMAEGVIIVAPSRDIIACNPSAERILGLSPGQLVGKSTLDPSWAFIREDGKPFGADDLPSFLTLRTGQPQHDVVIGMARPNAQVTWLSVNGQPIRSADGAVTGAVVSFTDITARKQAEVERARLQSQLQQAQKMEAVGQMAGGIAHDFNNILASIVGYASLGLDRYVEDQNSKLAGCLKEVLHAGERARELVAKLMAFSRARPVSARVIDPRAVVTEVVNMLGATIPSSIKLSAHVNEDVARTRIDPVHLQQVVMNLCVNARDAMMGRGEIEVSVRHVWGVNAMCASCQEQLSGDFVEIAVCDDGAGISMDQQVRIFEPFFTTKGPGKGTGLGLSVVHGIVHDYGGHIVLESAPGEGTSIRVWLRAVYESAELEAAAETHPFQVPGVKSGKHVLVIDDEDVLARLIAEVLRGHGYRVTSFSDSRAALDAFMQSPEKYDAIITDQTMPGITGRELAGMALKVRPDLPVILCTGYSDQIDEEAAQKMGIRRFVFKPIKAPDLALLLNEILATHH